MIDENISDTTDTLLRETRGKINVEWEIKKFQDLLVKECSYLNSGSFLLSDSEWYIRIYPNGQRNRQIDGWISLYLFKKNSFSEVRVSFRIGIKNADGTIFKVFEDTYLFEKKTYGYGIKMLCQVSQLQDSVNILTTNGSLIVFCSACQHDVAGVETATQASLTGGDETLSENFKDLYLTGCETDVSINVKGKQFKAHKSVLVARSPVFRSMFQLDMVEKNDNAVNITDCEPDFFEEFLLFLYSGKLDIVTSKNALELYSTADKYDVKTLKRECAQCLIREISVDSICDILSMAALYNETELLNIAKAFFISNSETILTTTKWLSFMVDHLTLANELFVQVAKLAKK